MNDARQFLHVKNERIKALTACAASARSDYEPDDWSTWEYALDADHHAYRKAHATLPSASVGMMAYSPPAVQAASKGSSGPLFSAARCLSDQGCQIDQSRSSSSVLTVRDFSTQRIDERNGAIRCRTKMPIHASSALSSSGLTMSASI